jgi:hypothetical protein
MPPRDPLALVVQTLRDRIAAPLPAWTDGNDSDPGVTLAAVFAYLGHQLATSTARLPAAARAELALIGSTLLDLDRPDAAPRGSTPDVRVDGVRWRAVADVAEAAADAPVFAVDPERGTVRFGDGVHGRRPPDGATITVQYRYGVGASGSGDAGAPSQPDRKTAL